LLIVSSMEVNSANEAGEGISPSYSRQLDH
jgi:hypothetical protein